ncbi:Sugar phosphate isomerase/epimerase [Halanaerobium congolense]|uniref:Sugar phosphate isomerase/epimerase n=1 Tax=Halanaerobium congolense TaxID=54121 RepID=A0A1G8R213_9FIRM|nr:sugar phosphate isomerase/epimerase family protein [Halanaerobium congolense]SDJ10883.1 Sugar phosphate isomerase/epimerase [Halanaerobium congolense]SET65800.1 Sugar phosphate isomerase/epimerase [Halanaerobium congolense]
MDLSISNIAWTEVEDQKIYKLMRKYDFNGLEIAPTRFFDDPYNIEEKQILKLKNNITNQGFEIPSMQSILYGRSDLKLFDTPKKREELKRYLKKGIIFASKLNINNLVFGSPKNRVMSEDNDYKIGIDFFSELADFAQINNTTISIEPNPKEYNTNFINTTREAINLVRDVNKSGFKVNFDLSTLILNGEKLSVLTEESINLVNHVHISQPYLNPILEGNIDLYKNLFAKLKELNYKNYISIEMKKVNDNNNVKNVEESLKLIRNLV